MVSTYSGGMKRRLEIARGLLHAPRVLFLDEPTVGLDPHTRSLIWEYVNDLKRRESITIFLTTHYMDGRGGALRSHPRSAGPRSHRQMPGGATVATFQGIIILAVAGTAGVS